MTQIIETRMIWDVRNKKICDHQSRVVEAESWDFYKDAIKNYNGKKIEFKTKCQELSEPLGS